MLLGVEYLAQLKLVSGGMCGPSESTGSHFAAGGFQQDLGRLLN